MADINFIDVYVKSIRNPKDIEYNISNLEEDLKREIIKANEYKELLREDKILKVNDNNNGGFELEKYLYKMCNYYSLWKEGKLFLGENININDEEVVKHLEQENHWSRGERIPSVFIKDFPNEKGYFCLWEMSINDDLHSRRILPIFINDDMIYRPFSGDRIWDEFLRDE